ncbi:hypothetical protein LX32DRAFT_691568 [Colletotrichum zoysiae]|uniref:Uncharacterized protein n=1 Tax=Colletotrichum zoysiae TaxID=1216348 RepID=A0AAD9M7J9_9PEZI|nr:hypothetical protein LX32DRAFT_691568 [Colletotrichum zoysiae]
MGPKILRSEKRHYLVLIGGGTITGHRATVEGYKSAHSPRESLPMSPLIYNGSAKQTLTGGGEWYASLLARRSDKGVLPLLCEAFLVKMDWEDDWSTGNGREPLLLNRIVGGVDQDLRKPK